MIRVNYHALRREETEAVQINEELLRKAKKRFSLGAGKARKELMDIFAQQVRLQAMEVAQRQMNPQLLVDAGKEGLLDALKVYDIGDSSQTFKEFATPFIKRAMESAKAQRGR